MHSFAVLLLAQLALSIPTKRSEHQQSPWSTNLKRKGWKPQGWSSWNQSGYEGQIYDNDNLKYLIPMTVGGQTFEVEIDTGSSNTWVIQTGFQCWQTFNATVSLFQGLLTEDHCNFGPTYTPGLEFQLSEIEEISCYGGSETILRCVEGLFGTADVEINGLAIPQQLIGAPVNSSFPIAGETVQSGLVGLAFPSLTSGYTSSGEVEYNSIIDTAFEVDDLGIQRKFSMALSRDESANANGGVFTIGGIPDLTNPEVNASDVYTSAPWQFVPTRSNTTFTFYSIIIDNFMIGSTPEVPNFQVIMDSGVDHVEMPEDLANAVNQLWDPPLANDGSLNCTAVLTEPFGVTIGGTTYYIDHRDLIGQADPETGICLSLIGPGGGGEFVVGDPLLKNTLAVFDWEGQQLS
jgi:hypothetical protein